MTTKHIRVLMSFLSQTDHRIGEIGGTVATGLNDNKKDFLNPPVDPVVLQATVTEFTNAVAASTQGGLYTTAHKNKLRHDLIVMLRKLALYVQGNCNDDLAVLTSSGFQAASTTRTLGPLSKPVIDTVDNGHSAQLLVTLQKVPKAKSYELHVAAVTGGTTGPWQSGGMFTRTRKLAVNNLTPGTVYAFKVRAIGGTASYSDWSDPVSHMSL